MSTLPNMSASTNLRKHSAHCQPDVHKMGCVERTQGDGMENVTADKAETKQTRSRLGDALIYHPTNLKQLGSTPPVVPIGTIVNLVPKNMSNVKQEKHILHSLKSKEPKFVPYEPYKAAVNPIVPFEKKNKRLSKKEINATVAQLAAVKIQEGGTKVRDITEDKEEKVLEDEWKNEKRAYEAEIHKLKEENSQLETQLKFQAQVNGELKNLLVAAVGEDLETRVHLLTEDKLQLARALLNSAQHLTTHQEQTEWLAGQCEVWRSKFLASSLMVEDLARWKAALCQRTTELQESMKRLLEEHNIVRDASLKTYKMLTLLREKFDPIGTTSSRKHELTSANIIDLAQGCCQLIEILKISLLSGIPDSELQREINIIGLDMKTLAEHNAEKLLMNQKLPMSGREDVACSAVMGAAVAIGGQMFLPRCDIKNMTCCPHCSGEIKQI